MHSMGRRLLAQFRTKSALPGGSQHSYDVLLEQIERDSQEHDVLQEEGDVACHCGKSGSRIPSIRHEWNNGDRRHKSQTRTESAENSQSLVPESREQEHANRPFGDSQEPAGSTDTENRVHPENERTVADIWNQHLCLVRPPFLISKKQKHDHHRSAKQVVIKVFPEKTELGQDLYQDHHEGVHDQLRWCARGSPIGLARDDLSSSRHPALAYCWSMIFSENRCPPRIRSGAGFLGIMLLQLRRRAWS